MEFLNQQYGIVKQYRSASNNGTGRMTTITLRGVTDNKRYTTYVVDKYKNARHWQDITLHPEVGYVVVFDHGKLSKAGQIDADSCPVILERASTVDIMTVIDEAHSLKPKKHKLTAEEKLAIAEQLINQMKELFND